MPRSVLLGSVALAASYMLPITVLLGSTQEQQNLRAQQNVNQKDARVLAAATSIIRGETNELTRAHSSNANRLMSQQAPLSQSATIQSLSSSVTTANEKLELGVYDSTGANGGPDALAAQTASFTAVTGWNTQSVLFPVTLPAGSYW